MSDIILVGSDGSIASRAAIDWAVGRAHDLGCSVALAFVVDDEWGMISDRDLAELHADGVVIAEREMAYARSRPGAAVITAEVVVGSPMLELAIAAADAECVVIGTHKTGSFHGRAVGSRSLQLAAMTPVPTVVVPSTSMTGRSGVVVGLGDAPGWDAPIGVAAAEAARLGQPLTVLRSDLGPLRDDLGLDGVLSSRLVPNDVELSLHRSPLPAGEALATASRRAMLTVSGRPTAPGASGYRPLGRANSELLLNQAGPVMIVPQLPGHADGGLNPSTTARPSHEGTLARAPRWA